MAITKGDKTIRLEDAISSILLRPNIAAKHDRVFFESTPSVINSNFFCPEQPTKERFATLNGVNDMKKKQSLFFDWSEPVEGFTTTTTSSDHDIDWNSESAIEMINELHRAVAEFEETNIIFMTKQATLNFCLWVDNALTQLELTAQSAHSFGLSLTALYQDNRFGECTVYLIDKNGCCYGQTVTLTKTAAMLGIRVL